MENYRTGSHSRFDIKYHFVWVTKYRKSVLAGVVGTRARDLVREICRTNEIEILQGAVSRDHVHVLLSCPPTLSPSKIMQLIQGKTSRKLMMEFKHIQKQYWGRHLWARGYFVASSGNVTDEMIAEYIRGQDGFVARFDTAGNFVWADQIASGPGNVTPGTLRLDAAGNPLLAYAFEGRRGFRSWTGCRQFDERRCVGRWREWHVVLRNPLQPRR